MDLFKKNPWVAIFSGTLFVVGGGVIYIWGLPIVGVLFGACGGLLGTWGWTKHSELQKKNSILVSVVGEWKQNDQMVENAISLAKRWNTQSKNENFSYQRYKTAHLSIFISSGLFGDKESQLLEHVQKYETALQDFNAALGRVGLLNPGLFLRTELLHNPPDHWSEAEDDLLGTPFRLVVAEHRKLGNYLRNQYSHLLTKFSARSLK